MNSKKVLPAILLLIIGFGIGYFINQSKINSSQQQGAVATTDEKTATPTEEQSRVIEALNSAMYKSEKDALSGTSLQKILMGTEIDPKSQTNDVLVLTAWCYGNTISIFWHGTWYDWHQSTGTFVPGNTPAGPCLYFNVDVYA